MKNLDIKRAIFKVSGVQFNIAVSESFIFPKFKNIVSNEDLSKNAEVLLCLTDDGWKNIENTKLFFSNIEEQKGKKVIHFRVSRRNSRHKKKGFRAKLFCSRLISISTNDDIS